MDDQERRQERDQQSEDRAEDQCAALLRDRYGAGREPQGVIWNPVTRALVAHRSVRSYRPDPLPPGALETMVAAAQSAPTSSYLHQWSLVVVTDPGRKEELVHLSRSESAGTRMSFLSRAPAVLLWVADLSRNRAIIDAEGERAESHEYLDALLVATIDAALAAQNAAVAAESLGLGCVFLGSLRNHARELAELLGLPPLSYVVVGLAVGEPDPDAPAAMRPRPRQDVVVHHESYRPTEPAQWLEDYEEVCRQAREREGQRGRPWRRAVLRAAGLDYMDGRQLLARTLRERGFGLR